MKYQHIFVIAVITVLGSGNATAQNRSVAVDSTRKGAPAGAVADTSKSGARQRQPRAPRPPRPGVFTSLDSALRMPDSVIFLSLRGKITGKLPAGVAQFKNMVSIDLSSCGLTQFPKELLACSQLSSIILSDNPIKVLPPEIGQLDNLSRLVLRNTGITTVPASLQNCKGLSALDVSQNPLVALPIKELNGLPRLKEINLGGYTAPPDTTRSTPAKK